MEIHWTLLFTLALEAIGAPTSYDGRTQILSRMENIRNPEIRNRLARDTHIDDCEKLICDELKVPVCGTDGITHENDCKLKKASCQNPEKNLTMDYPGLCSIKSESNRTDKYHRIREDNSTNFSHIHYTENEDHDDAMSGTTVIPDIQNDSCVPGETSEYNGQLCCCSNEAVIECNGPCHGTTSIPESFASCIPGVTSSTSDGKTCCCSNEKILDCNGPCQVSSAPTAVYNTCTIGETTEENGKTCCCTSEGTLDCKGPCLVSTVIPEPRFDVCMPEETSEVDGQSCCCSSEAILVCEGPCEDFKGTPSPLNSKCTPGKNSTDNGQVCCCTDESLLDCSGPCLGDLMTNVGSTEACIPGQTIDVEKETCCCNEEGVLDCTGPCQDPETSTMSEMETTTEDPSCSSKEEISMFIFLLSAALLYI